MASSPWRPILPVPADAGPAPVAHLVRGRPEMAWDYRDATGALLGRIYRFTRSGGGKEVLPCVYAEHSASGAREWHWMAFPDPRPLYGLDRLADRPDATVLVVEGEKCADVGVDQATDLVTITWPGGGKAVSKADWLPLAGRRVVIWPDCDSQREPCTRAEVEAGIDPDSKPFLPADKQPGAKAAAAIADTLLALGCRVWVMTIDAPGLRKSGWDIADAVAEGLTGRPLADFIRAQSVARVLVAPPAPADDAHGYDFPPDSAYGDSGDSGDSGTFNADGRRVIRHDPGQIALILDEMGAALGEFSAQGGSLFRWGSGLTRVYVAKADSAGPVRRWAGSVSLHPVSAPHLAELSTRSAVHERWDGRSEKYKEIDCPPKAAEAYLARGNWPELPELSGFIEGPSITLDGRVLDVPGYDPRTGIYAAWSHIPGYVSPPRAPTMRDAAQALDVLLAAISEFPFLEPADTNAALAGLILAVCRRSLPSAPLLCVTAPTPGTGKTLLTDTISILATGRRASVMAMGHDDAEADKRLAGVLLAGDSIINIDNVERPLGGDLLCQVLSQPVFKTRPLGASAMVDVPTCAIMAATGNNLSVQGDLKRRVTMIRMDARMERPETRDFSGEPHLDKIRRMRGELITAALTIPLAYLAAGSPRVGSTPLGGFEDWDTLCRRPLIWLGLDDPLLASQLLRDQDPDMETTRALMTAWRDVFAGDAVGVADVVREGTRVGEGFDPTAQSKPELNEALLMVTGGRAITTSKLGAWLRGHKDRIVSGMRIHTPGQDRNGTARWQVLNVQDDAAGFTSGGRM
jgi:putative DNA primase/helicase